MTMVSKHATYLDWETKNFQSFVLLFEVDESLYRPSDREL